METNIDTVERGETKSKAVKGAEGRLIFKPF
jgi:hypothetical protein